MLRKINVGTNEDGSTRWHYEQVDSEDPVMFTGPITGTVTTADGTEYDVTEPFIEVQADHAGEVDHAIGVRYEEEGHPFHEADAPFYHLCTDNCGKLQRSADDPAQAEALALARAQHEATEEPQSKEQLAKLAAVGGGSKRGRRSGGGDE